VQEDAKRASFTISGYAEGAGQYIATSFSAPDHALYMRWLDDDRRINPLKDRLDSAPMSSSPSSSSSFEHIAPVNMSTKVRVGAVQGGA